MKKNYITPLAERYALTPEDSILLTMSKSDETGEVEGGMSNDRTASSSIWGDED